MNTKVIAEIAQRSPTSENFFTYAACRERNVRKGISKLSALRAQMADEGFQPVPQDLLVMFRELERAGIGSLKGDTFKWNVPIKKVGQMLNESEPKPLLVMKQAPKQDAVAKSLVMVYGRDREVSVQFPNDLTKEEIEALRIKLLKECN